VADPKAKDAPKRLNLEARFDIAPPEVAGAAVDSRGSTLYSDAGDKPPVAEGPAKPGAKPAAKSVSDQAYGSAEAVGAIAARNVLTRDNGGAEAIAKVLQDHPTDRAAILREAEQLRGAGFAADVQRCEQKAADKPHDAATAVAVDASRTPDPRKHDERGAEIQAGQATEQGGETSETSADGGVHKVQQVDTQMTE
jgi:hypothetical protein